MKIMANLNCFGVDLDTARDGFVFTFIEEAQAKCEYARLVEACKGKDFVIAVKLGLRECETIRGPIDAPYMVMVECTRGGQGLDSLDDIVSSMDVQCEELTSGYNMIEYFEQYANVLEELVLKTKENQIDPEIKALFGDMLSNKKATMKDGEYCCPECGALTQTFYFWKAGQKNLQKCESCVKYYQF
jgi:hypothetical protein